MDISPFGTLPPELRNRIYEGFFHSQLELQIHIDIRGDHASLKCKKKEARSALALTTTCRQLRRETLAIFWSTASFRIVAETLAVFANANDQMPEVHPMNRANHINKDRTKTLENWLRNSGIADFARLLRPIELDLGMWNPSVHADIHQQVVLALLKGNTMALTQRLQSIDNFAKPGTEFANDAEETECTLLFHVQVTPSTALGPICVPNTRKQAQAILAQECQKRSAAIQAKFYEGLLTPTGHFVLLNDLAMCRSVIEQLFREIVNEEELQKRSCNLAGSRLRTLSRRSARKSRQ